MFFVSDWDCEVIKGKYRTIVSQPVRLIDGSPFYFGHERTEINYIQPCGVMFIEDVLGYYIRTRRKYRNN